MPGWHAEKGGVRAPTGGTTFVRGAEGGSLASGRYPHPDSEVKRWCVWCQIMKSPINHKFHLWGICQRNVHFPHILVIKMGCELPKPVIHHPGVFHFQLGHPQRKTFISHCHTSRGNSPIFTHSQKGEDVSDLQTPHSSKLKVTPNFAKCQTFESGFNKKIQLASCQPFGWYPLNQSSVWTHDISGFR